MDGRFDCAHRSWASRAAEPGRSSSAVLLFDMGAELQSFSLVIFKKRTYNLFMNDTTIINSSPLGQHLDKIAESQQVSYLVFNKKKIQIAAKITMGREQDNDIVIDSKLASRHHCIIQKIRDAYFVKDENSTNGTFLNGRRIPPDKYVKLNAGDKLTIGSANLIMG